MEFLFRFVPIVPNLKERLDLRCFSFELGRFQDIFEIWLTDPLISILVRLKIVFVHNALCYPVDSLLGFAGYGFRAFYLRKSVEKRDNDRKLLFI